MRVTVRVHPGARTTSVGGRFGDGEPPVLTVRVAAPATDGRATRAVVEAVAAAFGVPRAAVTIRSGATSRTKVLDVEGGDASRLDALLALPAGGAAPGGPDG